MTKWTPELEKLIQKLSTHQKDLIKEGLNKRHSAYTSVMRMAFRSIASIKPSYKKVCKALNLTPSFGCNDFEENLQKIADFTEQHNKSLAKELNKTIAVGKKMRKAFKEDAGLIKNIRKAKTLKIKF